MNDISGIGGLNASLARSSLNQDAFGVQGGAQRDIAQPAESDDPVRQTARPDLEQRIFDQRTSESLFQSRRNLSNDSTIVSVQSAATLNQVGGVNATNQDSADEENSTFVNGNQDISSEQSRALGQIVDQFA